MSGALANISETEEIEQEENSVHAAAKLFKTEWNHCLAVSPLLELDDTWPSVAVIDLLTYSLRLQKDLIPALDNILSGSAAYLAIILEKCWKRFADDVKLGINAEGVYIEASGGEHLPEGETLYLPLEREFRKIIQEIPFPFPVTHHFRRPFTFEDDLVSLFMTGAAIGLAPGVAGAWDGHKPEDIKPSIDLVVKELATQSADYYARCFPDEPLGQVAELYLCKLIYPPVMMDGNLPGLPAVEESLGFFEEYKVGKNAIAALAHNLSLNPNSMISSFGLAVTGAVAERIPPPEILARAQTKDQYMGILRRAMCLARFGLGKDGKVSDWVDTGLVSEEAINRFEIEKSLGFAPWLTLSKEYLSEIDYMEKLSPLIGAILDFNLDEAIKLNDKILEELPGEIELRLQRIKLEMCRGNLEKANEMFHTLFSEPGADRSQAFYNQWGNCALGLQNVSGGQKYYRAGYAIASTNDVMNSDIANNVAWAAIVQKDYETAYEFLDKSLETSRCPLTAYLNKSHLLWEDRRFEEVRMIRKRLFNLAPWDRRVFASIALSETILDQITS